MTASDLDTWVRPLLVCTTGIVSMSMLACILSLVRDTTGHEWYASGKLTGAEILIDVGFDDRARAEYRTEDSAILPLTNGDLKYNSEALLAPNHLHRTATNAAELGAWCGFGSTLLCLVLIPGPKEERRVRRLIRTGPCTTARRNEADHAARGEAGVRGVAARDNRASSRV